MFVEIHIVFVIVGIMAMVGLALLLWIQTTSLGRAVAAKREISDSWTDSTDRRVEARKEFFEDLERIIDKYQRHM